MSNEAIQGLIEDHGGGEHVAPENWKPMRTHKEFNVGDIVKIVDAGFEGHENLQSDNQSPRTTCQRALLNFRIIWLFGRRKQTR